MVLICLLKYQMIQIENQNCFICLIRSLKESVILENNSSPAIIPDRSHLNWPAEKGGVKSQAQKGTIFKSQIPRKKNTRFNQ
jgi:hypothetical protein